MSRGKSQNPSYFTSVRGMEYVDEDRMTISQLPADIIRRIIRMNYLQSLHSQRLISSAWNAIVRELLNNRRSLPAIVFFDYGHFCSGVSLDIIFDQQYEQFYGVEHHQEKFIPNKNDPALNGFSENTQDLARLIRLSSSISEVRLFGRSPNLHKVRQLLGDIPIRKLTLPSWTLDKSPAATEIICANQVRDVSVSIMDSLGKVELAHLISEWMPFHVKIEIYDYQFQLHNFLSIGLRDPWWIDFRQKLNYNNFEFQLDMKTYNCARLRCLTVKEKESLP